MTLERRQRGQTSELSHRSPPDTYFRPAGPRHPGPREQPREGHRTPLALCESRVGKRGKRGLARVSEH